MVFLSPLNEPSITCQTVSTPICIMQFSGHLIAYIWKSTGKISSAISAAIFSRSCTCSQNAFKASTSSPSGGSKSISSPSKSGRWRITRDAFKHFLCCDCVVRISPFTPFSAAVSFVVSPPISTVMPCILDAPTQSTSPRKKEAKRLPEKMRKKRHLLFMASAYVRNYSVFIRCYIIPTNVNL